jgi:hypothetical protein
MGAAAGLGAGIFSGFQSYQTGKLQEALFKQKAAAAKELGDYNSVVTINNTVGKVNELQSQINILNHNKSKALAEADRKYVDTAQSMVDEYSKLVLKTSGNYSSYDYLKAAESRAYKLLTDYDYQVSQATYQADVQEKELQRKTKLVYDLGLANADFAKYKANLEAYGLQAQGGIAYAKGMNEAVSTVGTSAMNYASIG